MSDTNSTSVAQATPQIEAIAEFLDILVQAVIGYKIADIPESKRSEIVKDCIDLFSRFIINYVNEKYGAKEGIRLKASQAFAGQDIFSKFADLGSKFDEAYRAFIDVLKEDLAKSKTENKS